MAQFVASRGPLVSAVNPSAERPMPLLKRRRPSPAIVVALLALFVALDGPATAARFVNGAMIEKDSITNRQVRNGTLGVRDLSRSAVRSLQTTPSRSVG